MPKIYRVRWEIDIEERSPRAAAIRALEIQQNLDSTARVFEIYSHPDDGRPMKLIKEIDLAEAQCDEFFPPMFEISEEARP